jgi:hypothetical protein
MRLAFLVDHEALLDTGRARGGEEQIGHDELVAAVVRPDRRRRGRRSLGGPPAPMSVKRAAASEQDRAAFVPALHAAPPRS